MKIFRVAVIAILIHISSAAVAQEHAAVVVGYKYLTGKSTGRTSGLSSNYASTGILEIKKNLRSGSEDWINALNAKSIGASIFYSDMQGIVRNEHYGNSYGGIAEIDFQLLEKGGAEILFTPGIGLAYMDRTTFTHPQTYIFGSHLNGVFKAGLSAEYTMDSSWKINISSQFIHFSNGSFQLPNAGVNLLSAGLGISRSFETTEKNKIQKKPETLKQNNFEFSAAIGKRGKYQQKKSDDLRFAFYGGYRYQLNNILAFKIGSDAVYVQQVFNPEEYVNTIRYLGASNEHWRVGIRIGAEIKMNKFSFGAGAGRYVYFKSFYDQKTYWNIGLRYYISPIFGVETALHANKFQADFASAGLFLKL